MVNAVANNESTTSLLIVLVCVEVQWNWSCPLINCPVNQSRGCGCGALTHSLYSHRCLSTTTLGNHGRTAAKVVASSVEHLGNVCLPYLPTFNLFSPRHTDRVCDQIIVWPTSIWLIKCGWRARPSTVALDTDLNCTGRVWLLHPNCWTHVNGRATSYLDRARPFANSRSIHQASQTFGSIHARL